MTAHWERFRSSLAGKHSEQIASGPIIAADHAAHLAGRKLSEVMQSADLLSASLLEAYRRYDGDFIVVFSDVNVEAEAMGARLEFPDDSPPFVAETIAPEALKSTMPLRDGRLPMMVETVQRITAEIRRDLPVFASMKDPFSAAALACGIEPFLTFLVSQPERAHHAVEIALQNQRRYLDALLETGADVLIGAPLASGGILGPVHFHNFAFQPIYDLISTIKSRGGFAGVHLCGDAEPILDQLVQLPADFLSLEAFDLDHWKRLMAKQSFRPALMGYVPTHLFLAADPETIKKEVEDECKALAGCPHILATACDVPQASAPEKIHCFMAAARALPAPVKM
jgi:uroporphyrinogen decarboxylase